VPIARVTTSSALLNSRGSAIIVLLLKSSSRKKLQTALTAIREWLTINKMANGIRWNIDVDPMDLS
jgi:primosomal protein N'